MKNTLQIIVLLLAVQTASAQASDMVIEERMPFDPNIIGFTTEILGLGEENVVPQWQSFIAKHQGTSEVLEDERGNIKIASYNVQFPPLDNQKVELLTLMTPNVTESGIDLTICIKMDDGTYVSSKNQDKEVVGKLKDWMLSYNEHIRNVEKDAFFDRGQ